MSDISILLVTGSFVPPSVYDTVVDAVQAKGLQVRALHSPTVGLAPRQGREGAAPTMYDDAAFIGEEIDKLADQGKRVILIAHSYGGIPATQSVRGRSLTDRRQQGKRGGIARLAYMTALVPEIGHSAIDVLADVPPEGQTQMETDVREPFDTGGCLAHLTGLTSV
ncbi:hypothetical protein LTR84_006754 [Exophiala bonariae]|uniref:AB hydrolase-1 domain-containing protein n=1 Tax=Exophiala bonariae TaxID=1690606 RepID=A0AAV9N3K5_9EURO|nr:hypothetical protein LTR84_006754 [Exophiala bonariae]